MEWVNIVIIILSILLSIALVIYLVKNQKEKIIEWLVYAVTEAEKQLGNGTGQLKLRLCYDWFIQKFPIISAIIPFSTFSVWVDSALNIMKTWLKSNYNIINYIERSE